MNIKIVILFMLIAAAASGVIDDNPGLQTYLIRLRVEHLTKTLLDRCPHILEKEQKLGRRAVSSTIEQQRQAHDLAVEKKLYDHIQGLLNQCYLEEYGHVTETTKTNGSSATKSLTKSTVRTPSTPTSPSTPTTPSAPATATTPSAPATPTTPRTPTTSGTPTKRSTSTKRSHPTTPSTTATPSTPTTHSTPSITSQQLPLQCTSASTQNLTEKWRNNAPNIEQKHQDNGILDGGRTWFRFTGAAGSLLKDTCPNRHTCGSTQGYWSNSNLPSLLGETVGIKFYGSAKNNDLDKTSWCTYKAYDGLATRCSANRDGIVYRLDGNLSGGEDTICGMD